MVIYSDWDVSSVTDMSSLFEGSFSSITPFNEDIGSWDVSNVTDMVDLFRDLSFNQDIGSWDVSSVTDMRNMFYNSSAFNQDIGNWDVSNVSIITDMFKGATSFSTKNYDNLLIGWATKILQLNLEFTTSTAYCEGETARDYIIGTYGWTFIDEGLDCIVLSNQDFLTNDFSFYPNPTSSAIQLNSLFNSSYTLYSSLGQTMSKGNLKIGSNNIDLSNYKYGVYFLKIDTDKGSTTKRIIKH